MEIMPSQMPTPDFQKPREKDKENSLVLKIMAAWIPMLGLFICQFVSVSVDKKLKQNPLPKKFKPLPKMGKILDENATPEEKNAACARHLQLKLIDRDYTKAALVNTLLSIALVIYAMAKKIIPVGIAAFGIVGFSISAAAFSVALFFNNRASKRYQKMLTNPY